VGAFGSKSCPSRWKLARRKLGAGNMPTADRTVALRASRMKVGGNMAEIWMKFG